VVSFVPNDEREDNSSRMSFLYVFYAFPLIQTRPKILDRYIMKIYFMIDLMISHKDNVVKLKDNLTPHYSRITVF